MLPGQARETLRKILTKPAKRPDGGQCMKPNRYGGHPMRLENTWNSAADLRCILCQCDDAPEVS